MYHGQCPHVDLEFDSLVTETIFRLQKEKQEVVKLSGGDVSIAICRAERNSAAEYTRWSVVSSISSVRMNNPAYEVTVELTLQ